MQAHDRLIGIDVGTQSAKCVVIDSEGAVLGVGQRGYPVLTPRPLWAEQDPAAWWDAIVAATRAAMNQAGVSPDQVRGIGLTGQMHGIVMLDADLTPLRNAIIWMDRRSADLIDAVQTSLAPEIVQSVAANRLSPGFAAATLAWFRAHDPAALDQTRTIIMPKDYAALRLTGIVNTDPSDAAATWLYDVGRRQWSDDLVAACGFALDKLPPVRDSTAVIGDLRADTAAELGLRAGIPVVAGAADQAAMLTGAGVIAPGRGALTIATGGQITVVSDRPVIDPKLRLNTFCHAAPGLWYTMGAILNGGMVLRWWRDVVDPGHARSFGDLVDEAAQVPAGSEGLICLPYLEGERTPLMDPDASAAFVGLTRQHTRAHITRAVLEGVAYAFRDCLETLREVGPVPDRFLIGGGGAQGVLWRQIMRNVLGVSLQTLEGAEHTAVGAALLAGVGAGLFADLPDAVARCVRYGEIEEPDAEERAVYDAGFARFRALYPAIRGTDL
jgi:xylulokinase